MSPRKQRKKLRPRNHKKGPTDICPRCARSGKFKNSKNRPKLLAYYKSLCRNSTCTIHKKNVRGKNIQKMRRKDKGGLLIKKSKMQKLMQMRMNKSGYITEEFDEENSEDIDCSFYKKINATVEVFDKNNCMNFSNTAGHRIIKDIIQKIVVWPLKNPQTFKGLRSAPKGLLLFGPPGSGKTFLGKLIAAETQSTFFNISPSHLISKWLGENEKLVRTMFTVAKACQPSVIFVDEIDSILSTTCQDNNGSMRRMKNEFLGCMGDSNTTSEDRVTVIGATNHPHELDEESRHKFSKRIYIPLPDEMDRKEILLKLLECECHSLENFDLYDITKKTEGYSISDLKNLCQEAAMGPIKGLAEDAVSHLKPDKVRPISMEDFLVALELIKPTVSGEQIKAYEKWDYLYGYGGELNSKF